MKNKTLRDYAKNVFSQYGEDGITEEILRRINIFNGVCVEFGASDGVSISNTAALWAKKSWRGILIEADKRYFKILPDIIKDKNCKAIQAMVMPTGENSIESILTREGVDFNDVKVMSIDIDGDEYHILNGLTSLKPALLIVEYNQTIPPERSIISKEGSRFGSSARALCDLAHKKGYSIVSMTNNNCFFVDSKYISAFSDLNTEFENIVDRSSLTYLITSYDGKYAFSQDPVFGMSLPLKPETIKQGNLSFFVHLSWLQLKLNPIKHQIKMILKTIIGPSCIERFRFISNYIIWKAKGMPWPGGAHVYFKRNQFRTNAKKYKINTFIETGTAGGGTVIALRNDFKKLYTIELDPTLYLQGKAKTAKYPNIECLEGDSGSVLKELLKKLNEPAVFWLDAHYSGPGTARAAIDTPIVQEIQQIFSHKIKKHVIIIDDMREFNGTNDYPPLDEFKKTIEKMAPEYVAVQKHDLLVIEPRTP